MERPDGAQPAPEPRNLAHFGGGYTGFFIGPPIMGFLSEGLGLWASFVLIEGVLLVVPLVLVPMLSRRSGVGLRGDARGAQVFGRRTRLRS